MGTERLTAPATAQTVGTAPTAPASPGHGLITRAAGSALGSPSVPTLPISLTGRATLTQPWPTRTLYQAFARRDGWQPSDARTAATQTGQTTPTARVVNSRRP